MSKLFKPTAELEFSTKLWNQILGHPNMDLRLEPTNEKARYDMAAVVSDNAIVQVYT